MNGNEVERKIVQALVAAQKLAAVRAERYGTETKRGRKNNAHKQDLQHLLRTEWINE